MNQQYVPEAGDIIWINFTPQVDMNKQAIDQLLVLSPASYNKLTSYWFVAPDNTN